MSTPSEAPVRVMVVDDSPTFRRLVCTVLAEDPRIDVVTSAMNGEVALVKAAHYRPEVMTLDLEMPVLGGLEVLKRLRHVAGAPRVLVLSAQDPRALSSTMEALEVGATDFVLKPDSLPASGNAGDAFRQLLVVRILGIAGRRVDPARGPGTGSGPGSTQAPADAVARPPADPRVDFVRNVAAMARQARDASRTSATPQRIELPPLRPPTAPVQAVGIGSSTGGPQALTRVIPALPGDLPVPVLLVQHMPPHFTRSLAESLDRKSPLSVREALDGEPVVTGSVLVAPGGRHMVVQRADDGEVRVRLHDGPMEHSCRPAVDPMFRSLAEVYEGRVVAAVLTGMGEDGAAGARQLRGLGARVVAQDEDTSVVWGMPGRTYELGGADAVLPLDDVAGTLVDLVKRSGVRWGVGSGKP